MINTTQYNLNADEFENLVSWAKADSCKIYSDEAKRPSKSGNDYWPAALTFYSAILSYKQEDTGKDGWKYFAYLNRFLSNEGQNVSIFNRLSMSEAMLTCLSHYFERDFTPYSIVMELKSLIKCGQKHFSIKLWKNVFGA